MIFTLANLLTLIRVLLTPLFIYCLFQDGSYYEILALIVFVTASMTDAYDGYFARKLSAETNFGKFFDPLADKVLMSAAFISLVVLGYINVWMVILVLLRDFIITGMRIRMTLQNRSLVTRKFAKAKTGVQIGVICFVLVYIILQRWELFAGLRPYLVWIETYCFIDIIMLIVTVLTLWTGIEYLIINRHVLRTSFIHEKR
jgi:CDP-diacylglycerol--glycerol-3-phosphate 3-phosphatidyltransferase